jgi:hypothetical protein
MVNIPPLVFFYWAAKIGGEIEMKKLLQKEFDPTNIGIGFVHLDCLDLLICLPG